VVRPAAESSIVPVLRRAFRHGHGANQALHRVGTGHRAWADPVPALRGSAALERLGVAAGSLDPPERRRLGRLARLAYASRVAGSLWCELHRPGRVPLR
jgi:hypothetical protein